MKIGQIHNKVYKNHFPNKGKIVHKDRCKRDPCMLEEEKRGERV